jgi:hypothetical protein
MCNFFAHPLHRSVQSLPLIRAKKIMKISSAHRMLEQGYRGRYSDWLRAGLSKDGGSSPIRVRNLKFSMSVRLTLGPKQLPMDIVVTFSCVKRPGREVVHSLPTSAEENLSLTIILKVRKTGEEIIISNSYYSRSIVLSFVL